MDTLRSAPIESADIARLREDFAYYDRDDDGHIGFGEFVRFLSAIDAGMTEEECRLGFAEVDTDHDGLIDVDEFIEWWGTP